MSKQFKVEVSYIVTGYTLVEAETEEEAMQIVEDGDFADIYGEEESDVTAESAEEVE